MRYPTAGSSSCAEAQPLFTNYPYGICAAHNGNLTNTQTLRTELANSLRHINTGSDSELLLNVFAEELQARRKHDIKPEDVFEAVKGVMARCKGAYGVVVRRSPAQSNRPLLSSSRVCAGPSPRRRRPTHTTPHATCDHAQMLINGVGLLGFRDPHGIRPLVFGKRPCTTSPGAADFLMASESVAIDTLRFSLERDVGAGEAIFITLDGTVHAAICAEAPALNPCIFEYVYFARPDSIMDGVQVYEARLNMGEMLARKILRLYPDHDIDVVIPVPDTSRTSGLSCAYTLGRCVPQGPTFDSSPSAWLAGWGWWPDIWGGRRTALTAWSNAFA